MLDFQGLTLVRRCNGREVSAGCLEHFVQFWGAHWLIRGCLLWWHLGTEILHLLRIGFRCRFLVLLLCLTIMGSIALRVRLLDLRRAYHLLLWISLDFLIADCSILGRYNVGYPSQVRLRCQHTRSMDKERRGRGWCLSHCALSNMLLQLLLSLIEVAVLLGIHRNTFRLGNSSRSCGGRCFLLKLLRLIIVFFFIYTIQIIRRGSSCIKFLLNYEKWLTACSSLWRQDTGNSCYLCSQCTITISIVSRSVKHSHGRARGLWEYILQRIRKATLTCSMPCAYWSSIRVKLILFLELVRLVNDSYFCETFHISYINT